MWLSLLGKVFLSMKNIADNSRPSIVTTVLTTSCRYSAEGIHRRCFHRYCWWTKIGKRSYLFYPYLALFLKSDFHHFRLRHLSSQLQVYWGGLHMLKASWSLSMLLQPADVRPQVAQDSGHLGKFAEAYAWHLFSNRYRNRICVGPLWKSCSQPSIWGNSSGVTFMSNIWCRTAPFLKKKSSWLSQQHTFTPTDLKQSWNKSGWLMRADVLTPSKKNTHGALISERILCFCPRKKEMFLIYIRSDSI